MPSKSIVTPIEAGAVFHIYNRGSNYQTIFFRDEDYKLFLEKLKLYVSESCSIYAYALLPNHYHLLLRINEEIQPSTFSAQFAKLILSYTNTINRRETRNGSLFLRRFRRIKIDDENYFKRLIFYVNYNPVKHGCETDYKSYKYSSYSALVSDKQTSLCRQEVLDWFGGRDNFVEFHSYLHDDSSIIRYTLEED